MRVKILVTVFIVTTLVAGKVSAQTDFHSMAKNTITVDVGPTIIGSVLERFSDSGFGIAMQYERQFHSNLSLTGRFAYMDMSQKFSDYEEEASFGIKFSSYSIESHIRYYPVGKTFFLDGILGYANFSTTFSGDITYWDENNDKNVLSASTVFSRGYIKYGVKLGWRISFGKNGGFTFEPSIGFCSGIGIEKTIGDQISEYLNGELSESVSDMLNLIADTIFVGGPRVSLAFGYCF
jgi:hypothetical protein